MKRMAYQGAFQVVSHVRRTTQHIADRSNLSYNYNPIEPHPPIAHHGVVHHVSSARSHLSPIHDEQKGKDKIDHAARARAQYFMLPYLDASVHAEALIAMKKDCEKGGRGIKGLEPESSELEIKRTILWHTGVEWSDIPSKHSQTFAEKCTRRELLGKKESWQEKRLQEYRNQESIYLQ